MSWAVAEVRKHIIDLLAEQVGFGADGAHIVFNRGYPVVLFEKPFCELFQKKHGVDPNQLKEDDPRIIEMWSDVVCTFFRELRAMLDKEEKRRSDGQRLAISVNVLGTNEDNIQYGVDIRRLVGEGLLNSVFIYQYNFGATKKGGYDVAFFRDACEAKGVPFAPSVDPPYDLEGQLKAAVALYEGGAKRLLFWDAGHSGLDKWAIQTRLGHVEESRWRRDNLDANKMPRSIHFFKWWGEQRMDGRFPPYWGG
jgi:hypothetical protein